MAAQGPFYLSAASFHEDTPRDVVSAALLLQAHGYTLLQAPPVEIGAAHEVSAVDLAGFVGGEGQEALKRRVRTALGVRLGQEAIARANFTAHDDPARGVKEYRVALYVVSAGNAGLTSL